MENRFKVTPIIIILTSLSCNKNSRVGEEGVELQHVCWEMCLKFGTSTRACPISEHNHYVPFSREILCLTYLDQSISNAGSTFKIMSKMSQWGKKLSQLMLMFTLISCF